MQKQTLQKGYSKAEGYKGPGRLTGRNYTAVWYADTFTRARFTRAIWFMNTVYDRFNKWAKKDIFEGVFAALSIDADMQDLCIDNTSVKVHQHAADVKSASGWEINQYTRVSLGGKNTKIHALVDGLKRF